MIVKPPRKFSFHVHPLIYGSIGNLIEVCTACQLPLSGPSYCCTDCYFFLHVSCTQMPERIKNPFFGDDWNNLLSISTTDSYVRYDDCKIQFRGVSYAEFTISAFDYLNFHIRCAALNLPTIEQRRHEWHRLFYDCHESCVGAFYPLHFL